MKVKSTAQFLMFPAGVLVLNWDSQAVEGRGVRTDLRDDIGRQKEGGDRSCGGSA